MINLSQVKVILLPSSATELPKQVDQRTDTSSNCSTENELPAILEARYFFNLKDDKLFTKSFVKKCATLCGRTFGKRLYW